MEDLQSRIVNNKKIIRWLDYSLVVLGISSYFVYLNNRHNQLAFVFFGLLGLFIVGSIARFALTYPKLIRIENISKWTGQNWPLLIVVLAIALGGWYGQQAIKQAGPLSDTETRFTTSAVAIVKHSNWNTTNFTQPPLYLNLTALTYEAAFVQQLGKGSFGSPDDLKPDSFKLVLFDVNLLLSLVTLIPLYATATRLYGKQAGAMAAFLLALTWTHYSTVAYLEPQTLACALLMTGFYFGVKGYQDIGSWSFLWAGILAGLATATTYGSIWLLPVLGIACWFASTVERFKWWQLFGGWLAGFTFGAVGWILNLPGFINGLGSIGATGDIGRSFNFYFKEFLKQDAGLLILVGVAVVLALVRPHLQDWLALIFVMAYALTLLLIGPYLYLRLDLLTPFAVLAAVRPLEYTARYIQTKITTELAGSLTLAGLTIATLMISIIIRRFG